MTGRELNSNELNRVSLLADKFLAGAKPFWGAFYNAEPFRFASDTSNFP